ncbi:hypothetical protein BLA13014_04565 [Burkholderia aenigmatica]|uniref:P-type conjugative transfer protein TrbJ n=1 Tax=Burkholderia aenigmatica TaxID=2015348 RepID=A0A6P2NS94_9BURK|nr:MULTISPECIES: conjugal transfer protein TrbJ [Burkholderiaceae]VWB97666.1 hypothetical protein BLA13014_04565 [Burkholderia aenigmatica]
MKLLTRELIVCVLLLCGQSGANAGTIAGTGGSTEVTQILNNLQLIQSYEQQVQAYVRQGVQVQNELRNLMSNPTSILGDDVGKMINTIGSIWNGGQSIGYNLAQIDQNFARTFKSPTAGNLAKMFTSWHQTNTDTLQSALRAIGTQRDNYASSQAALTDLYNRSQATNGNLDSLQTLSQINIRQIQELQSLQELMATQSQAATTYMATQNAKDQKGLDDAGALSQPYQKAIPAAQSAPAPKWKGFGYQ